MITVIKFIGVCLLILFLLISGFLFDILCIKKDFNIAKKEKQTNYDYDKFERLYRKIKNTYEFNFFRLISANEDYVVIKVFKNYYSYKDNGLTHLFNEKELILSEINKKK